MTRTTRNLHILFVAGLTTVFILFPPTPYDAPWLTKTIQVLGVALTAAYGMGAAGERRRD